MHRVFTTCLLLLSWNASSFADQNSHTGPKERVRWTTSHLHGTPDPPSPYRVVNAFPRLKFNEPLAVTRAPGTNRLFVAERFGKLYSFVPRAGIDRADLMFELKDRVFFGFDFHPNFAQNGYVFVTVLMDPERQPDPKGTRVSRFRASGNPPRIDPDSELVVFEWPCGGHNGGCLKFGPDGYLYIGTGDNSGIADQLLAGQDLGSVSGAILRIDVDKPANGKAYSIPADNPFAHTPAAAPEIWAYGLRQPWKFTFDRQTHDLWCGNVGQDLWEQIFLIRRGGNYGWSVMEGSHPFRPERPRGPTPFIPPVVEHDHAEFRSITGGYVYRGDRLPDLRGAYIYGDYDTGKVWSFRYDRANGRVSEHGELVDSSLRLIGFAETHAGELYLADHMTGTISRLETNPAFGTRTDFPRKLSETGLFAETAPHTVAAGVIAYDVNAPQWVDGAKKQRFLAVPNDGQIGFDGITYPQPAPGAPHGWRFPNGTVLFETLSLEMEAGNPASAKRLETRVLHFEQTPGSEAVGDQFWRGYTYIWNADQTDATLLEDRFGKDVALSILDPRAPGGKRTQTWHFPARTECIVCHNMAAKYVLGANTMQLNRPFEDGHGTVNQLAAFDRLGLFDQPLPDEPGKLARLADYRDASVDRDRRARSYLHANCAHCHRKWGGGNGEFRMLSTIPLAEMGIAGVLPKHGNFFIPDAQILSAGKPHQSTMFYRMAKLGPGRMPRLGSSMVDAQGLELIGGWIGGLSATESGGSLRISTDTTDAEIDRLLSSTSDALRLASVTLPLEVQRRVVARAVKSQPHVRDLFERYLPEEQRIKRLGTAIRPERILSLAGDPRSGRELFLKSASVQCRNCHKVSGAGTDIGPDLSEVGKKFRDPARLLDTILYPSREIEPKWRVYLAQTDDGRVHSGLLVSRTDEAIVLKDAKGKLTRLAAGSIETLVPQQQSLMPDLLLRDMTAQQVADLTAYLSTLVGNP